jgi:hypothetical protein
VSLSVTTTQQLQTVYTPAGSSRLYEDPDVDEYGGMDDVGYVRRSITNQQDFVMSQLDFLRVSAVPPLLREPAGIA